MKLETSGTCAPRQAGLGLATVRAQSQAITVSSSPSKPWRRGWLAASSGVILSFG